MYITERETLLNLSIYNQLLNLTHTQWELLEQCIKLLKPFETITKIASSGISCISEVISHAVTLLKYLGTIGTMYQTPQTIRRDYKNNQLRYLLHL